MNYAVRTERAKTEKYVESAARGMPNCKLTNYETVVGTTDFDKVVFMGVLRGTHLVYKHAQKNNKDFYYNEQEKHVKSILHARFIDECIIKARRGQSLNIPYNG